LINAKAADVISLIKIDGVYKLFKRRRNFWEIEAVSDYKQYTYAILSPF
jgi:hypothetical protein